jgi:hypothetical protein
MEGKRENGREQETKTGTGAVTRTEPGKETGTATGNVFDPPLVVRGRLHGAFFMCVSRSGIECLKRNRKNSHQQPLPGSLGKTGRDKAGVNIQLSQ